MCSLCSFILVSVGSEGAPEQEDSPRRTEWATLPWFGRSEAAGSRQRHALCPRSTWLLLADRGGGCSTGPSVPLRASRAVFLPLWNNVDFSGEAWREMPSDDDDDDDDEQDEEDEEGGRSQMSEG